MKKKVEEKFGQNKLATYLCTPKNETQFFEKLNCKI